MTTGAPRRDLRGLVVGLDLDNTIILYDRVFHRAALECGMIHGQVSPRKAAVKTHILAGPDGELQWRRLQSEVYAKRVQEAEPASGVREFLRALRQRGGSALVISHKTILPMYGDFALDLRRAAMDWLAANGFLAPGDTGLGPERIYFESSRQEKIRRIAELECACFVDDLEEVLLDRDFPAGTARIHYAPDASGPARPGVVRCDSWQSVRERLLP